MSSNSPLYQAILDKEVFSQLVVSAAKAVPAKPIVHLLDNLKFDCKGNHIRVTGYDLQFAVVATNVEPLAEAHGECSFLVRKDRLEGLVGLLPFQQVLLKVGADFTVEIADAERFDKVYLRLQGQSANDYPEVQSYKETQSPEINIAGSVFKGAVDYTRFATSYNDVRLYFNGVFFQSDKEKLTIVGTDGYRMAVIEREVENLPQRIIKGILPSRPIQEVSRLLPEGEVKMVFSRRDEDADENSHMQSLQLVWPGFEITMRLLDSTYPDYRRVIPKDNVGKAIYSRSDLVPVVKTLLALGKKGGEIEKAGLIEVEVDNNLMRCHSKSQETEGSFEFAVEQTGPGIKIVFDGRYLQDLFSNVGAEAGETMAFEYSEPLKQALFTFVGDAGYRYVMMPIREQ